MTAGRSASGIKSGSLGVWASDKPTNWQTNGFSAHIKRLYTFSSIRAKPVSMNVRLHVQNYRPFPRDQTNPYPSSPSAMPFKNADWPWNYSPFFSPAADSNSHPDYSHVVWPAFDHVYSSCISPLLLRCLIIYMPLSACLYFLSLSLLLYMRKRIFVPSCPYYIPHIDQRQFWNHES